MGNSIRASGGGHTPATTVTPGPDNLSTPPDSSTTTDAMLKAATGFAGGFLQNMMAKQKEAAANLAKDPDDDS